MPPPERAVVPPNTGAFSVIRTSRPAWLAVRAAVMPPAPEPTTTTSTVVSNAGSALLVLIEVFLSVRVTGAIPSTARRQARVGSSDPGYDVGHRPDGGADLLQVGRKACCGQSRADRGPRRLPAGRGSVPRCSTPRTRPPGGRRARGSQGCAGGAGAEGGQPGPAG